MSTDKTVWLAETGEKQQSTDLEKVCLTKARAEYEIDIWKIVHGSETDGRWYSVTEMGLHVIEDE